jgi:hypothetical protein
MTDARTVFLMIGVVTASLASVSSTSLICHHPATPRGRDQLVLQVAVPGWLLSSLRYCMCSGPMRRHAAATAATQLLDATVAVSSLSQVHFFARTHSLQC